MTAPASSKLLWKGSTATRLYNNSGLHGRAHHRTALDQPVRRQRQSHRPEADHGSALFLQPNERRDGRLDRAELGHTRTCAHARVHGASRARSQRAPVVADTNRCFRFCEDCIWSRENSARGVLRSSGRRFENQRTRVGCASKGQECDAADCPSNTERMPHPRCSQPVDSAALGARDACPEQCTRACGPPQH